MNVLNLNAHKCPSLGIYAHSSLKRSRNQTCWATCCELAAENNFPIQYRFICLCKVFQSNIHKNLFIFYSFSWCSSSWCSWNWQQHVCYLYTREKCVTHMLYTICSVFKANVYIVCNHQILRYCSDYWKSEDRSDKGLEWCKRKFNTFKTKWLG